MWREELAECGVKRRVQPLWRTEGIRGRRRRGGVVCAFDHVEVGALGDDAVLHQLLDRVRVATAEVWRPSRVGVSAQAKANPGYSLCMEFEAPGGLSQHEPS